MIRQDPPKRLSKINGRVVPPGRRVSVHPSGVLHRPLAPSARLVPSGRGVTVSGGRGWLRKGGRLGCGRRTRKRIPPLLGRPSRADLVWMHHGQSPSGRRGSSAGAASAAPAAIELPMGVANARACPRVAAQAAGVNHPAPIPGQTVGLGSLAGAAHLLRSNEGARREAQCGRNPHVERKGKSPP